MERCRLVRYDEYMETLDQSFDEPEVQSLCVYSVALLICCQGTTFGQAVGGVKSYYSFELFMEIRNEDQQFRVYNRGGERREDVREEVRGRRNEGKGEGRGRRR